MSLLVAIFAGVLATTNFVLQRADRRHDRRRKVFDEFWFQKVYYPEAIQPILKLYQGLAEELEALPEGEARLHIVQNKIAAAERPLVMLTGIYKPLKESIQEGMNVLEDQILAAIANKDSRDKVDAICDAARVQIIEYVQSWHSTQ